MATLLSTLHLPARLDTVAFAGALARHACEAVGLGDVATMRTEIAVVEACTNVVEHALRLDETCSYTATFEADGDALVVTIRDAGADGAPYAQAPSTDEPDPDALAEGSYGVPLIFAAAREVAFRREDGHNVLTLRFDG